MRKKSNAPPKSEALASDKMALAIAQAELAAAQDEVPVGAVIFKDGKPIASAFNLRETQNDPVAHAEILALRGASKAMGSWRLEGCVLFVTLEPCPMCLAACQQARIAEVVYGASDPKGGALSLGYRLHEDVRTNHRFPVRLEQTPRCGELLSVFFKGKRAGK